MKTSYFFTKNNLKSFFRPGWKGMGDPGVEEVETRIYVKPERGCGAVYLPCRSEERRVGKECRSRWSPYH